MPEPPGPVDHEPAYVRSSPAPATWQERLSLLTAEPPLGRGRVLATVAAVALGLVIVAVVAMREPAPPPELTLPVAGEEPAPAEATTTTAAPDVVVHAAGAVATPGVYRLASGARVADLLDRAGGPVPEADLDRLNLAAALPDGGRVYVPVEGEPIPPVEGGGATVAGTPSGGGAAATDAPGGVVDLNTADAAALETLPGIGPATAAAILDERARRGRFSSVEELLEVRGIGDAKLAAIRDRVAVP